MQKQFRLRPHQLPQLTVLAIVICLSIAAVPGATARPLTTARLQADSSGLAKGQQLFQTNCSACHNFLQKGIGPSLERVSAQVPVAWLKAFIRNAPDKIAKGDARANQLFADYKQMMPAFTNLTDADIDALLLYIKANQRKESLKSRGPDGIKNPIPATIAQSGLTLELEHYSTAPASASAAPAARINKMAVLPGGAIERVFVVDLQGKLYELVGKDWRVALDMAQQRPNFTPVPGLATGFGSFAFHPNFYQNGLLYTSHAETPNSRVADFAYADSINVTVQWVVTEWKITDPTATALSGSSRELMRVNMIASLHGMQEIAFNPTAKKGNPDYGLLYIGLGDGGASENGYPFLCNSTRTVWSSVLRIDPQGRNSRNGQYGIPKTNPFANHKDPATLQEVYCRGFRNPNRLSWTPDGKLLITDIGHANIEEINLAVAGADYGWPNREGTFVIRPGGRMDQVYARPGTEPVARYVYPIAQYDHDEGKAISGGFVYSGTTIPQLQGKYLFGDLNTGRVFVVDARQFKLGQQTPIQELRVSIDGPQTTFQTLSGTAKPDVRFGAGAGGELFVLTKWNGAIYRVKGVK
jgi:glucose/arabinose dehydrogenase/mono/diheme cytochrome c family protein